MGEEAGCKYFPRDMSAEVSSFPSEPNPMVLLSFPVIFSSGSIPKDELNEALSLDAATGTFLEIKIYHTLTLNFSYHRYITQHR